MTRPPAETGAESPRLAEPSRRLVLAVSATAPILGVGAQGDACAEACGTWLARHAEHERLGKRWQQIETKLFKEHNWSRLTRAQRKRFPEKHEMDDLYDRMDALHSENEALLASLPAIVATTDAGICSKLAVAAIVVCPEDHPEAHELISSALRDYRALHGA